jgi:hypothetical protein
MFLRMKVLEIEVKMKMFVQYKVKKMSFLMESVDGRKRKAEDASIGGRIK